MTRLTKPPLVVVLYIALGLAVFFQSVTAFASEPTRMEEAHHQPLPAVDGLNAKFDVHKSIGGQDIIGGSGSVAMPLGHRFGFQLDGGAFSIDSDLLGDLSIYGAAAHVFWRDPNRALVGACAQTIHLSEFGGLNFHLGAVEFEWYWRQLTFESLVGLTDGDFVDLEFFSHSKLAYYMTDNLRLDVGFTTIHSQKILDFGGEWAFANNDRAIGTVFLNGSIGDGGDTSAMAGLRFYIGQTGKSLIRRHREDDPAGVIAPSATAIEYGLVAPLVALLGTAGFTAGGAQIRNLLKN